MANARTTTTTKNADLVAARQSWVGSLDGREIRVHYGELFEIDHPAVKKWPDLFGPLTDVRRVESATAAPGEVRGA